MTGTKRRIHPFHQKTTRAIRNRCGAFAHVLNALGQIYDQFLCAFARIARISDASNIAENIGQTCWLEVHYSRRTRQSLRELRHSPVTDRADVAQFLGQNYVRLQFSQKRFVDRVNRAVVMQCTAHPLVHFAARHIRIVNGTVGDARPFVSLFQENRTRAKRQRPGPSAQAQPRSRSRQATMKRCDALFLSYSVRSLDQPVCNQERQRVTNKN